MSVVDEIKAKLDIVDVVSESVKLRKSGRSFSGFCPFHANSRTPAFYVFPDTQSWHCFGACGTGGDVFTFVMKKDNLDFAEALRMLAQRAGVELHQRAPDDDRAYKTLLAILRASAERYHYLLKNSPAAQFARDYVVKRHIHADTVEQFELGFAPNEYESLKNYLVSKDFALKDIEAAGLISPNQTGGGYHDRFRGRLMFPIRNRTGEIIAFGARALNPDDQPKYLNSPETMLFSKSATLYGLDAAKETIRAENLAVIVEGYTDVIIAHQAGFKNVVASLGTALTEKHLDLLKRLTKRYALALDADEAGDKAVQRGLEIGRTSAREKREWTPLGKDVFGVGMRLDAELLVFTMPAGLDPDEVILRNPDEWRAIVQNATPMMDYYFQSQTRDLDLQTAKGKALAKERLLPVIRDIADSVQRTHYLQRLARLIRVDERVLAQDAERETPQQIVRLKKSDKETPPHPQIIRLENYFVALALAHPTLIVANDFFHADDLAQGEMRALFDALTVYTQTHADYDRDEFAAQVDDFLREGLLKLDSEIKRAADLTEIEATREMEATAFRLRLQHCQEELAQLAFLQQETTDADELARLTERANELRIAMAQYQKQLQSRTLLSRIPNAPRTPVA